MSPPLVALRCFCSVFLIASLSLSCSHLASAAAHTLVTALPGFDGALPSRLETGYVTVDDENGVELFYYFIDSEGDPGRDPFLLWLTGGDRCSVLCGLLFEIGPFKFIVEPYNGSLPRLRYNPYSWTKFANILFIDSPVGAGFSFSRNPRGYNVGDVSASLQLKKFLTKWFSEHPEYIGNPFYIGADSIAAKIVPFLVQKISEDIEAGLRPHLNMKGYLVGNPRTGESIDFDMRVPYAHGVGIMSDQLYETIQGHCQGEDHKNPKNVICAEALNTFNKLLLEISKPHILYDKCTYVSPRSNNVMINRKILKEEVGVLDNPPPRISAKCFSWVRSLNFSIVDSWRAWHLNGQSAGFTIAYSNNMTFATVKGGGHTAPEYQPERCLAMFQRWMSGDPL